jgi:hypothetical protein
LTPRFNQAFIASGVAPISLDRFLIEPFIAMALSRPHYQNQYMVIGHINGKYWSAIITSYIVSLSNTVYVVHCFQKKSKRGIKTPKEEIEVIKQRLKLLKFEVSKR